MEDYNLIAYKCAPLIKGKWRYIQPELTRFGHYTSVLQNDNERGMYILFSEYYGGKGRIKITGSYPRRYYSNVKITVSKSRSIYAIASDINKRFLPSYTEHFQRAKQAVQTYHKHQEDLQIRADLLKKIVPSLRPYQHASDEVASKYHMENGHIDLHSYSNDARIDLHVNFDDLVKILCLLNKKR